MQSRSVEPLAECRTSVESNSKVDGLSTRLSTVSSLSEALVIQVANYALLEKLYKRTPTFTTPQEGHLCNANDASSDQSASTPSRALAVAAETLGCRTGEILQSISHNTSKVSRLLPTDGASPFSPAQRVEDPVTPSPTPPAQDPIVECFDVNAADEGHSHDDDVGDPCGAERYCDPVLDEVYSWQPSPLVAEPKTVQGEAAVAVVDSESPPLHLRCCDASRPTAVPKGEFTALHDGECVTTTQVSLGSPVPDVVATQEGFNSPAHIHQLSGSGNITARETLQLQIADNPMKGSVSELNTRVQQLVLPDGETTPVSRYRSGRSCSNEDAPMSVRHSGQLLLTPADFLREASKTDLSLDVGEAHSIAPDRVSSSISISSENERETDVAQQGIENMPRSLSLPSPTPRAALTSPDSALPPSPSIAKGESSRVGTRHSSIEATDGLVYSPPPHHRRSSQHFEIQQDPFPSSSSLSTPTRRVGPTNGADVDYTAVDGSSWIPAEVAEQQRSSCSRNDGTSPVPVCAGQPAGAAPPSQNSEEEATGRGARVSVSPPPLSLLICATSDTVQQSKLEGTDLKRICQSDNGADEQASGRGPSFSPVPTPALRQWRVEAETELGVSLAEEENEEGEADSCCLTPLSSHHREPLPRRSISTLQFAWAEEVDAVLLNQQHRLLSRPRQMPSCSPQPADPHLTSTEAVAAPSPLSLSSPAPVSLPSPTSPQSKVVAVRADGTHVAAMPSTGTHQAFHRLYTTRLQHSRSKRPRDGGSFSTSPRVASTRQQQPQHGPSRGGRCVSLGSCSEFILPRITALSPTPSTAQERQTALSPRPLNSPAPRQEEEEEEGLRRRQPSTKKAPGSLRIERTAEAPAWRRKERAGPKTGLLGKGKGARPQ